MERHVGWCIVSVHDDSDKDRIGYGQCAKDAEATNASFNNVIGRTIFMRRDLKSDAIPFERRVKWRSFSDDGDPAYDGVVDINWLYAPDEWPEEDQDMAFNLDRFNMDDWGAVHVFYNAADIRRCRPNLAEHVAKHPRIQNKDFLKEAGIDSAAWIEVYS